ncbi:hypothetical protein Aph02nite_43680 [Actinoplanes philippinensis]|nr:hypothetical protein Aph02nite_43680 [Actinoplanes philippinensis]
MAATPAHADWYPNRYWIQAFHSDRCLDVIDGSANEGARVQQWDCNSNWQQQWAFNQVGTYQGMPLFQIASRHTNYGKCLDVLDGIMTNGQPIQQWTCDTTPQQRWIQERMPYVHTRGGYDYPVFRYRSMKNSTMCLDISGVSPNNGARLHIWGCHNGFNQMFDNWDLGSKY